MSVSTRLWKLVPPAAVGAAAVTIFTNSAYGFFPPLPTGGPVTPTVTPPPPAPPPVVLPPVVTPPPVILPVNPQIPVPPPPPPVFTNPNGGTPNTPTDVPDPPVTPSTVPEPATILSGVIGLGVLGGYARLRRRNGPKG